MGNPFPQGFAGSNPARSTTCHLEIILEPFSELRFTSYSNFRIYFATLKIFVALAEDNAVFQQRINKTLMNLQNMNSKVAVGIIVAAFVVSLFCANLIMLTAHESSHAIVLMSAGIPFDFSVNPFAESHARPLAPVPDTTYRIFNLAGGLGAATVMGLLFFLVTRLENRTKNSRVILAAVGVEAVFLYFTFQQIGTGLWEGVLTENYHNMYNDPLSRGLVISTSLIIAVIIMIKLKLNTVKHVVTVSNQETTK
jgi:hypothetical protein